MQGCPNGLESVAGSRVVAEREFVAVPMKVFGAHIVAVPMKVFGAHIVEGSHIASLQERPEALDAVGGNHISHELAYRMVHPMVVIPEVLKVGVPGMAVAVRNCDPCLWELLKGFVDKGVRCVHCVQKNSPLPGNTLYYGAPLHFPPYMLRSIRKNVRGLWLAGALQATEKAGLVCLDPDNGIAPEAKMHLRQGPKFTYLSDLREFWDRGQSLVVYHHLPMDRPANDAIREKADLLRSELGQEPIALRYYGGSARVFFVVPRPEHKEPMEDRVSRFLERGWREQGHFAQIERQPTEIGDQGDVQSPSPFASITQCRFIPATCLSVPVAPPGDSFASFVCTGKECYKRLSRGCLNIYRLRCRG